MAAPVADRVGQPRSPELMAARIERLLAVAAAFGYTDLVLGAWGCGAFGNDVDRTAEAFVAAITGPYAGTFAEVVFAVRDWSDERATLGAFARAWARAAERREIRRPINLDDGDLNADWIKYAGRARRGDRELG